MEDLLPALSQCPDIIQQSTNWLAVFIGAAATLGGAALGAWLGARGAYSATSRAHRDQLRWEKLEQALMEVEELYYTLDLNMQQTVHLLREEGPESAEAFSTSSEFSVNPMSVRRIELYVDLFFEEGRRHVVAMREALHNYTLFLYFLKAEVEDGGSEHAAERLEKLIGKYERARKVLKAMLRGKLLKEL